MVAVDAAANASFADAVTQNGLFDVDGVVDVAVAAAAAAAATAVADVVTDVVGVDDDLILFNLGFLLNFRPKIVFFTLHSLFIESLANGHNFGHNFEWAALDDE